MDVSIFLAKALGLYVLIMAIMMFAKEKKVKVIVKEICSDPAMLFISGCITLMIGILLINVHNIWSADWRILITLIAWLAFIKGIIRTLFPHIAVRVINKIMKSKTHYQTIGVIALLIGVVLCYYGYMV